MKKTDYSLNIDAVEVHLLKDLLDKEIGNLVTLPPYVDASRYTAQIIALRKKIDFFILDIRRRNDETL